MLWFIEKRKILQLKGIKAEIDSGQRNILDGHEAIKFNDRRNNIEWLST